MITGGPVKSGHCIVGADLEEIIPNAMAERFQRAAAVAEAISWIGTRWEHRCRAKGSGVDCAMLIAEVFERAGVVAHFDAPEYAHDAHLHRDAELLQAEIERLAVRRQDGEEPRPGDVVLFRYGRALSHAAIVVAWPRVVHAQIRQGVILDDVQANADLSGRLAGAWNPWGER
jgi:cell wall-associated NlpC family hydrolase